jgi:FecR protein
MAYKNQISAAPCKAYKTVLCAATVLCMLGVTAAQAASLRMVNGNVQVVRDGSVLPATKSMRLKKGDVLQSDPASPDAGSGVAAGGEALVRFDDGARLALRNGSSFEIQELQLKGPAATREKIINVIKGSLRYISGIATVRQKVTFTTSTATIGIRGTDIEIVVSEEAVQDNNPGTYLKVNTGAAVLTAPDGAAVDVAPGEVAYGGEPELNTRGVGGVRRAAARKVQAAGAGLFKSSSLDRLMN